MELLKQQLGSLILQYGFGPIIKELSEQRDPSGKQGHYTWVPEGMRVVNENSVKRAGQG